MGTAGTLGPRPRRSDARANRERLLVAASTAFAEAGLGVSVDEIASRAGVGMGTLYRHFPSKEALIAAVFEQRLDELADSARQALAVPDPWQGFCALIEHIVGLQHEDRGFKDVMAARFGDERNAEAARARVAPSIELLIRRAQAAGALRSEIGYEDVSVLLWATGEVVAATRDIAPGFWRRYVALVLDALRAPGAPGVAPPLPLPPLTPSEHQRVVAQFARGRRP